VCLRLAVTLNEHSRTRGLVVLVNLLGEIVNQGTEVSGLVAPTIECQPEKGGPIEGLGWLPEIKDAWGLRLAIPNHDPVLGRGVIHLDRLTIARPCLRRGCPKQAPSCAVSP
jgi:hypothetical protein